MIFKVHIDRSKPQYFISTEVYVDRNTHWRQVSSGTHNHGPPVETLADNKIIKLERNFQISKHLIINHQREN